MTVAMKIENVGGFFFVLFILCFHVYDVGQLRNGRLVLAELKSFLMNQNGVVLRIS